MAGQQQGGGMMSAGQPAATSSGASGAVFPDVDMSHLSEEERLLIESVMAKAQMEELEQAAKPTGSRYSTVYPHILLLLLLRFRSVLLFGAQERHPVEMWRKQFPTSSATTAVSVSVIGQWGLPSS